MAWCHGTHDKRNRRLSVVQQHPILQEALDEREKCLKRLQELDAFIRQYKALAGMMDESSKPVSNNEVFKVLSMKESTNWAERILKEKGVVQKASDFIKEFEKEGFTIPQNNTMSSYMSQRKDRFKFDKEAGGWVLVNARYG